MTGVVNPALDPGAVPPVVRDAVAFHRGIDGYAPTPVRPLDHVARELGLEAVLVKDESDRLGLPAFKILGASWAVERALLEAPQTHTLVAASAGNHGRAVARAAALRGLACRVLLPERSLPARREAIAAEGAEVVVGGTYEDVVAAAASAGRGDGVTLISDVGADGTAEWVIDGYATLFDEAAAQADFDLVLVPVGVGSLAAAAARFGAEAGVTIVGVEPATAACLTASLRAGAPATVATPGTTMAGLDCAEVSPAAWPSLLHGIAATVTVTDEEVAAAMRELAAAGLHIGESGAAPLAALRAAWPPGDGPPAARRVLLVATEGLTGARP